jgi:colanic acid/amylovoran biosynthesis glycosyltransferase
MKIAYMTVRSPYGKAEAFFIPEIKEVISQGNQVAIFPFRPDGNIVHEEARELEQYTHAFPLLCLAELRGFLWRWLREPVRGTLLIGEVLSGSRTLRLKLKNLMAIPKGFYFADLFETLGIEFIHAHWASTPSTVAYLTARLTGIPWCFTAHRWDIPENNLLEQKVGSACFVRAIDLNGRQELCSLLRDQSLPAKVQVIHMGVTLPATSGPAHSATPVFTMVIPAFLVPKKGHRFLLEACRILDQRQVDFRCLIAGQGPLEKELKAFVQENGLQDKVSFLGMVPNDRLKEMYLQRSVDLVVLPSIVAEDGQLEGIPVALMEAMSYGVPVISTDTGGIAELVSGAGIMVPQRDARSLAEAIHTTISDGELTAQMRVAVVQRIREDFDVKTVTKRLLDNIGSRLRGARA